MKTMKAEIYRVYFALLVVFFLSGCFGTRDLSSENLSSVYRNTEQVFHPEFSIYQKSDSISEVSVRFRTSELLYVRQSDDQFKANLKINVKLVESYESPVVLDTTTLYYSFDMMEKGKTKVLTFDLHVKQLGTYLLNLSLVDENKNYSEESFVNFNNTDSLSRQFFKVCNLNGQSLFSQSISEKDTIRIEYYNPAIKKLWCKYYHREFILPPTPFSFDVRDEFNYHPDSIFSIDLNDTSGLTLVHQGFYHFQVDTTVKSGLTLFRFSNTFPDITTAQQMYESMRYLTYKKEYESIKEKPSLKAAVDEFWLNRGGNAERTRALIRKYYTRVEEANRYFSSYTEGWRTDRGMIYIIFGSPNSIYRGAVSESWIYGTPNSNLSLNFFFVKVNNPFTDNDFTLTRSPIYESSWYRAVEVWRQGRAYNNMN